MRVTHRGRDSPDVQRRHNLGGKEDVSTGSLAQAGAQSALPRGEGQRRQAGFGNEPGNSLEGSTLEPGTEGHAKLQRLEAWREWRARKGNSMAGEHSLCLGIWGHGVLPGSDGPLGTGSL